MWLLGFSVQCSSIIRRVVQNCIELDVSEVSCCWPPLLKGQIGVSFVCLTVTSSGLTAQEEKSVVNRAQGSTVNHDPHHYLTLSVFYSLLMFLFSFFQSKEVGLQLQEDLMKVLNELYTVRYKHSLNPFKTKSNAVIRLSMFCIWFVILYTLNFRREDTVSCF